MLKKYYMLLIASISLCLTTSLFAQTPGIIKGQINDLLTKEAIIGAGVLVKGTTVGATTDIEGNFIINRVPVGTYTLVLSSVGYKTTEIPNVSVEPDKITLVNTTLATDQQSLQEVVVRATRNTNTEVAVITQIREAQQVVSGISAEQIVKSQDRDAAEVVRRIPGVTIVDNRFINIRGLNDRYNTVWLNDAVAPSSETDRKAFSFDIIPANLLDRVLIFKTPAPELPGDFAGGMVKVYTRQPSYTERSLNVSYTVGVRSGTTFNDYTHDVGYGKDWLGFGAVDRKLPLATPDANGVIPTAQAKSFPNTYPLTTNSAIPDQRFNLSYLTGFKIGGKSVGSLSAISYSNTFTSFDINRLDVYQNGVLNRDKQFANNVRLGLLQNFIYSFGNGSKIEFRNTFNQLSRNQVTTRNTFDAQNTNSQTEYSYSEGYQGRQVYNGQLAGNHTVNYKGGLSVDWVLGYASSNRHEPDLRRLRYNATSNQAILPATGVDLTTGSRLYQDLTENIYSLNLNLKQKFTDNLEISAGTYIENRSRQFVARLFGYSLSTLSSSYRTLIAQPINTIFNTPNVERGTGFGLEEDGASVAIVPGVKPNYSYDAKNSLTAGYLSANYTKDKIKLLVGARFEHNVQSIVAGLNGVPIDRSITTDKLLPSVNFSYNITEKALIRAAYGRTLNRPEFREWAPFFYYDFDLNANIYGSLYNPSGGNGTPGTLLKVADIDNFDLRYEYYPSNGENVHFGFFYKHFNNPIESSIANTSNLSFSFINAPSAYAAGVELDVRKRLDFLNGSFFKNLTLLFNGSLIKSEVNIDGRGSWTPNRKLQGQSPYVVNTGLYYQTKSWQFSALYNVFGPRIVYVGSGVNPPYSEVVEMPRNTVDLTITRDISDRLSINFGISDLLNQRVLYLQDDPNNKNLKFERATDPRFQDYRRGSYYTLGLRYRPF